MKSVQTPRETAANPLHWPPASKAWLLFLFCVVLHGCYAGWAFIALSQANTTLDPLNPVHSGAVLLAPLLVSGLLAALWSYLRRVQPHARWHEYAALLYYSLGLCLLSYSTGTLSMVSGAMLIASPVLGFMFFRPAPVFWSLALILLFQLALGVAGTGWPRAPWMAPDAATGLTGVALASAYLLVLPFFVVLAALSCYAYHGSARPGAGPVPLHHETADPVTGLPNRESILTIVDNEWDNCRLNQLALSILIIELDHFEQLDEYHGPGTRDRALKEAARRMRKVLRRSDYLGRLGEGRFLLVLPSADLRAGRLLAARCHEAFHVQPVVAGRGHRFAITASMGMWCETDPANASSGVMLQKANAALYRARERGRDQLAIYGAEDTPGSGVLDPYSHWLSRANRTGVSGRM